MNTSKTTIKERTKRKTNSELVDTINAARKNSAWMAIGLAKQLSSSTRKMLEINLNKINEHSEDGDTIIIPGKVLSQGNINKKIKICAFKFSSVALNKLHDKKCETRRIIDEINKNPKAEKVRILI